jgi:hypothetical protein
MSRLNVITATDEFARQIEKHTFRLPAQVCKNPSLLPKLNAKASKGAIKQCRSGKKL